MKVLFIGYYKETSEWGHISTNYIRALDAAGVDVACRAITFTGQKTPEDIKHLENKSIEDCDYCIQHVFPDHFVASDKFKKNVIIVPSVPENVDQSSWRTKIGVADQIWSWGNPVKFPNQKTISRPVDHALTQQLFRAIDLPQPNTFRFYTITPANNITGLNWLLHCFHSEFKPWENVSLVVATQVSSAEENKQSGDMFNNLSSEIKQRLRLRQRPEDYIKDINIAIPISMDADCSMHMSCDQFVSTNDSMSEKITETYAKIFGTNPITIGGEGVPYILRVRSDKNGFFPDIDNANAYTRAPDERAMKVWMRESFEKWQENPIAFRLENQKAAKPNVPTLEQVGQEMKELLNA